MSENRVLKSSLIVILVTVLGKVLALVRDALVTSKFGAKNATDMYMFCIGIVLLLTTISYGLTTTFIPLHTETIEKREKEKRYNFANNVLNVASIITVIITLLGIIFAKYIVIFFGNGFTDDSNTFNQCVKMIRIMMFSLIFINIQSVITGVLQSHKRFFAPASMALASNLVHILYLVFLSAKFGIIGFAFATVVGFLVQLLINLPQYKHLGYKYKPIVDFKDRGLKNLFILMLPVIISTSVVQLNLFVNRSFATQMHEGAVTTLDLANKINTLGYEVFAIAISMVIYPSLSTYAARKENDEYIKVFTKAFNVLCMIIIPVAVGTALLRLPIIDILFKRGKFTDNDAARTAEALLFYTPAMVAYGIRDILNKAFYSIKDTKTPMINSFIGVLINIVLDIILIKYMKVSGLTLATTISLIITTIMLIMKLHKNHISMDIKGMMVNVFKIIFASFVMGIFVYLINYLCKSAMLSIIISLFIGVFVYFSTIALLKIQEFSILTGIIKTKILKK